MSQNAVNGNTDPEESSLINSVNATSDQTDLNGKAKDSPPDSEGQSESIDAPVTVDTDGQELKFEISPKSSNISEGWKKAEDIQPALPTLANETGESQINGEGDGKLPSEHPDINSSLETPIPSSGTRPSILGISTVPTSKVDTQHFFTKAFESISSFKEVKKSEVIKNSIQRATVALDNFSPEASNLILNCLKVTCENSNNELKAMSIGLFVKLFDYTNASGIVDKVALTDASVEIISSFFEGESTDPEVELQVVRALMHCVLTMPCHGASLLKAVRQIYNIFIFSLDPRNQSVAQGILTQVIGAIFQRVGESPIFKTKARVIVEANHRNGINGKSDSLSEVVHEKLTLKNLERLNTEANDNDRVAEANHATEADDDLAVKDAFLIFRAMCKLSVKALDSEAVDMRSHEVRSKLLSLHIIHTILKENMEIFLNPEVVILSSKTSEQTKLINAVRQYLCLSLSRNAASPLAPVFELSIEIFWLVISNLRAEFKREIPVFWDEIYFPIAELKTSTSHQKRYLLSIIERICNDSRCILEFYLNYDCDSFMPNICEKIIDYLTKLSLLRVDVTSQQKLNFFENRRKGISVYHISKMANLTSSSLPSRPPEPDIYTKFPLEFALKVTAINCIVAFLRSLYSWAQKDYKSNTVSSHSMSNSLTGSHLSLQRNRSATVDSNVSESNDSKSSSYMNVNNTSDAVNESDDPEQFENLKQRKKALLEGIRRFNIKPNKGIDYFLDHNFIHSDDPKTIASFIINTEGLNKASIGEFLGEGNERSTAIMHAFVDLMDFTNADFVDSLRMFLQSFRLPGEAQKIDRFMLKFAERYVLGNPTVFANADSAYVLAYSVIMLNTDLHSPQVKNRMTFEDFFLNNKGIDDGKDLSADFLRNIYDKIQSDEIKLQSEQHAALLAGDISSFQSNTSLGFFGGRDLNLEAYLHVSKEMSTKTEKLVRDIGKKTRNDSSIGSFYIASHVYHVKSIFNTLWMSILAGLTSPFKEYDDYSITNTSLEGIKLSIKIACMFDLEYARTSFIGALVQFQHLNNFEEMKPKNIQACYVMLDIAVTEANHLRSSWIQIATSISQLERLQLIAQGVDQDTIPDVSTAKLVNRTSIESTASSSRGFFGLFTSHQTPSQIASNKFHHQHMSPEIAELLSSTELDVAIDKVFTNSANFTGDAIIEFVKAASKVSAEEIESSGQNSSPRMFTLQKLVDICYYNMSRIRLEWSQLWAIMGETFNEVCCHPNIAVVFFSLDSLRQLSMRFLDIEELSHFKFQKEFLKPFEHAMTHNDSLEIKDMVLECLNNMILAKANKIKSGWKTIFSALAASATENKESLVMKTYRIASWINNEYRSEVVAQDSFPDMVLCFTKLAENYRFQRISLLSLDSLKSIGQDMHDKAMKDSNQKDEENDLQKNWFPILFSFREIIMQGEELEVRSRALTYLFDVLFDNGSGFTFEFWEKICKELLFPIFSVLGNHWELNDAMNNDKLTVWLSTTLIQALRNMITLFSHFFDALSPMIDGYLELLISCICQENDTIARIGRSCMYTLLIDNADKFNDTHWEKVVNAFRDLFCLTSANELFTSDPLRVSDKGSPGQEAVDVGSPKAFVGELERLDSSLVLEETKARLQRSKEKSSIVVKCVIQLLMIETLSEIFDSNEFYESIPYKYLNKLASLLKNSYKFAKRFNDDYDLRVRLWNAGVIERLPNLLKQESGSAAVYINIMFRMYCDDDKTNSEAKKDIMRSLIPLCITIIDGYADFDETNQQRNIATWKPVIVEIYQGYVELDDPDFIKYAPEMYTNTLQLLTKHMHVELRLAVRTYLARVGDIFIKRGSTESLA